jgi:hypothetical protein
MQKAVPPSKRYTLFVWRAGGRRVSRAETAAEASPQSATTAATGADAGRGVYTASQHSGSSNSTYSGEGGSGEHAGAGGGLGELGAGRKLSGGRVPGLEVGHAQLHQQTRGKGAAGTRRGKLTCSISGDGGRSHCGGLSDGDDRVRGEAMQERRGGGILGAFPRVRHGIRRAHRATCVEGVEMVA